MAEGVEKQRFRNEIQGLRACASVLIAVYHIWFNRVSGGVDVFFVVSGFLIIGSLGREAISSQTIALGSYATRMARRIIPLAYFVIAVAVVGTWIFVSRVYWEDMFAGIRAAVGYFANFHFASTSVDYLNQDASASPVQHFWAMSIQGQFYIVVPFFVLFSLGVARIVRRSPRVVLISTVLLVTVVSFVYSVIATPREPAPMYFNSFARIWEFGIGGFIAVALSRVVFPSRLAAAMSWLGVAVVFLNAIVISDIAYPGYIALVPVLGAALLLLGGQTTTLSLPIRALGTRPLVRLGEYSYGFFLWHWPLLVFGKLHFNADTVSLFGGVAILIGAFILAMATYHLIETPFLNRRRVATSRPNIWETVGVCVTVVVIVGSTIVSQSRTLDSVAEASDVDTPTLAEFPIAPTAGESVLFDAFRPLTPDPLVADEDRGQPYKDGCFRKDKSTSRVEVCSYGNPTGPTVALVGGSHSLQWTTAVKAVAEKHQWNLQVIVKVTCRYGVMNNTSCGRWVRNTEQYLLDNQPDLVVLTATIGSKQKERVPPEYLERWDVLRNANIPVLAIRDNPWFPYSIAACVDENRSDPAVCAFPRAELLLRVNPALAVVKDYPNMAVADFTDYLCDSTLCYAVIDNIVTYRDRDHLTSTFVSRLAEPMEKELLQLLPSNALSGPSNED